MVEFDNPTISTAVAPEGGVHQPSNGISRRRSLWRLARAGGMALFVLMACGWGLWKFTGSVANTDDEESLADLQDFENAPLFQNSREREESSTSQLGTAAALRAPGRDEMGIERGRVFNASFPDDDAEPAHVRLTGTIEEADTVERIEMPDRLSGSRDDSIILR